MCNGNCAMCMHQSERSNQCYHTIKFVVHPTHLDGPQNHGMGAHLSKGAGKESRMGEITGRDSP